MPLTFVELNPTLAMRDYDTIVGAHSHISGHLSRWHVAHYDDNGAIIV